MIEYSDKNSKRWATLGERPTFGLALLEIAKDSSEVIAVVADTTNSAGLDRMKTLMPEQVVNVGIAEQNMIGVATGLASEGYKVVTSTFAPFQVMRCLEQIRVNQGYMQQKIVMVGLASGVAYGELGHTHCCIEDVALMRAIPNIAVIVPADCTEVAKCLEKAIEYEKSVYIRLMDKTNIPIVYSGNYEYTIGKAIELISGGEISIIANGTMVYPSISAAEEYYNNTRTRISVYDMHTVKPIDEELIKNLASRNKAIIVVEEHNMIGGLGSAISEVLSQIKNTPPVYYMGIPDEYCHGASRETILRDYKLDKNGIINKIKCVLEEIGNE